MGGFSLNHPSRNRKASRWLRERGQLKELQDYIRNYYSKKKKKSKQDDECESSCCLNSLSACGPFPKGLTLPSVLVWEFVYESWANDQKEDKQTQVIILWMFNKKMVNIPTVYYPTIARLTDWVEPGASPHICFGLCWWYLVRNTAFRWFGISSCRSLWLLAFFIPRAHA